MTRIRSALLLAAAMIAVALLGVLGIVPKRFAQLAPFVLLALFSPVWLGRAGRCAKRGTA